MKHKPPARWLAADSLAWSGLAIDPQQPRACCDAARFAELGAPLRLGPNAGAFVERGTSLDQTPQTKRPHSSSEAFWFGAPGTIDPQQPQGCCGPAGFAATRLGPNAGAFVERGTSLDQTPQTKRPHSSSEAFWFGAPGTIRTCDRLVRSQVLYPAELQAREGRYYKDGGIGGQGPAAREARAALENRAFNAPGAANKKPPRRAVMDPCNTS